MARPVVVESRRSGRGTPSSPGATHTSRRDDGHALTDAFERVRLLGSGMTPIEVLDWTFFGGVFAVVFAVLSWALWEQAQHYDPTETRYARLRLAERVVDGLVFLSLLVGAGAFVAYCVLVLADISELTL